MAGIGFQLRRLTDTQTLSGLISAYSYSALISSGPWLVSILSIIVLHSLLKPILVQTDLTLFTTTITYAYAMGLILVGPLQLVLTRVTSDVIARKEKERVMPSCMAALCFTSVIAGITGFFTFGLFTEESLYYRLTAMTLLVYVSCSFVVSNYLSVLRGYRRVALGFAVGYGVSCAMAYLAAEHWGVVAGLFGFASGHLVLLTTLIWSLQRELPSRLLADWGFIVTFKKFRNLALCGLFYNLGIWIDKILFWQFSANQIEVSGFLKASIQYDIAIYLSLLSIVPGMAFFFLKLETDFAEKYHAFFDRLNGSGTLAQISEAREALGLQLRHGFTQLIIVQGAFSLILLVYAEPVGATLGLGAVQVGIFRVTLIGAFLLIVFMSVLTVLFYFEDSRGALLCAGLFAGANAVLSVITLMANEAWYGFGFVVAAGAALLLAAHRVNQRTAEFEFRVFHPAIQS